MYNTYFQTVFAFMRTRERRGYGGGCGCGNEGEGKREGGRERDEKRERSGVPQIGKWEMNIYMLLKTKVALVIISCYLFSFSITAFLAYFSYSE